MSNTKFQYLYRDAGNYKQYGEVVFKGSILPKEEAALKDALFDGQWFNAKAVGVPERFFEERNDDDHGMHEFICCTFTTEKPTDKRSISAFVKTMCAKANTLAEEYL